MREDTFLSVPPLGLLTDAIGTPLSNTPLQALINTWPSNGMLGVNPDGAFTYVPSPGFTGTDSFTYIVSDGNTTSLPATVTLTVYAIPVAANQSYNVSEGSTFSVASPGLLTNAVGSDLIVAGSTPPMHGTLQANGDGSFFYTPTAGYWARTASPIPSRMGIPSPRRRQ